MQLVLILVGQVVAQRLGVIAGIFAACLADTVGRRAQVGAGAAQVLIELVGQLVENFFQLRCCGSQKNNVARGAVHVGDAAAAHVPQVAQLTQIFGGVEFSAGLVDAHGVKVRHAREHLRLVAITADDAAAVTENTDDAAMLPVGASVFER